MNDLFSNNRQAIEEIYPDMLLLANFASTDNLTASINQITESAPFRKMMTPNGHKTGIALSNCGDYGWVSDFNGYRYSRTDPETNQTWPLMPDHFKSLANKAATKAGYQNFIADSCLINHYPIGSKLNSHQDKNEQDFAHPIVSVSIGLPATFQIFGKQRYAKAIEVTLFDGDVMVWGGQSRLVYHAVKTIKLDKLSPNLKQRFNLTFRKAF